MAARVPKAREHDFPKKNVLFLKFIGLVKPLCVLYPSGIMYRGSTGSLLVRAMFARSIKCTDCSQGPQNPGSTIFGKKNVLFLKFIGPVTALWVLQPSQIMHMVSTEPLLTRAVFTKPIKVLGWQAGAPKSREHDLPKKKNVLFFEFHRTSDTSMGSISL